MSMFPLERYASLRRAVFLAAVLSMSAAMACVEGVRAERFGPSLGNETARPVLETRHARGSHSPAPLAKRTLSMGEAVRYAVENAPGTVSAEAQSRASAEGARSQLGLLGPKLGTTYSFNRQKRESSQPNASSPPSAGTWQWGVEISQTVFDGMRRLGNYGRAALQAESDRAALRKAELETACSVQELFIDYLCALERVASDKEACSRLRDQLEVTRAFHGAGLRPKLDVLQAEVELGKAEQALISAENRRDTLRARLNTGIGLSVSENVAYAGGLVTPAFAKTLEQCLETAYRLRPDLYIGHKAVEIAIKDRLVERSGYYPQIEAYYNITKSGNTPDLERAGSHSSKSTTWEVGARLTWDVFQWGTTYFADQKAGWLVAKARSEVRGLTLGAGSEVKERYLALREARKRIDVARRSLSAARESYDAALGEYQAQLGINLDVLDASSKLLAAQADLTEARGDYLKALAGLYKAMGEYHPDLL